MAGRVKLAVKTPPKVVLVWTSDERADIYVQVGGRREDVGYIDHDDEGWAGMEKVRTLITRLGEHLGFEVVEEGEPGV